MGDKLLVSLSTNKITIIPGKKSEIKATIKNTSDVTESYSVTVDGIDPRWCSLSTKNISLSPGGETELYLTIQPPLISSGEAVRYSANLKFISPSDSSNSTTVPIEMPVGLLLDFNLDLTPKKQVGRTGSFTISVTNTGDRPTTYTLEGNNPYSACRFQFKQQTIDVQPGQTVKVSLLVEPKDKPLRGSVESYKFNVVVTPVGSLPYQSKKASGELTYKPVLRTIPVFLLIVAGLIVVASINGLSSLGNISLGTIPNYILTINMDGKGTFSGAGTYEKGSVISIGVNPDPYWEFVEWIGDTDTVANRFRSNTELILNENYAVTAHLIPKEIPPTTISDVVFSPQSPSTLEFGEWVTMEFKYLTNVDFPDPDQSDLFILPRPLSNGSLTPDYISTPSPLHHPWQSEGEGGFTISPQPGEVIVDQIRFQIVNADRTIVKYEFFFPVNFTFRQDPSQEFEEQEFVE
jgi:hypothetical protein